MQVTLLGTEWEWSEKVNVKVSRAWFLHFLQRGATVRLKETVCIQFTSANLTSKPNTVTCLTLSQPKDLIVQV